MPRITIPSGACPPLPHFSTLSHKRHGLRGKVAEHEICVLVFSTFHSETFLFQVKIREILSGVHVKYPLFLYSCQISIILESFSAYFRKILEYQISWKWDQWEPSFSIRTDRQTWGSLWSLFEILRTRPKAAQCNAQTYVRFFWFSAFLSV
jgi:hypothetical protein